MADRIRTDETCAEFLRRLCGKHEDGSEIVFASYYQALTFAACLGHHLGTSEPIANAAKEPEGVRLEIFQSNKLDYIIDLLSLAESGDPRVLADDPPHIDDRCHLFESYANTGLRWLKQQCSTGSTPQDSVLAAIARFRPIANDVGAPPSLSSLIG